MSSSLTNGGGVGSRRRVIPAVPTVGNTNSISTSTSTIIGRNRGTKKKDQEMVRLVSDSDTKHEDNNRMYLDDDDLMLEEHNNNTNDGEEDIEGGGGHEDEFAPDGGVNVVPISQAQGRSLSRSMLLCVTASVVLTMIGLGVWVSQGNIINNVDGADANANGAQNELVFDPQYYDVPSNKNNNNSPPDDDGVPTTTQHDTNQAPAVDNINDGPPRLPLPMIPQSSTPTREREPALPPMPPLTDIISNNNNSNNGWEDQQGATGSEPTSVTKNDGEEQEQEEHDVVHVVPPVIIPNTNTEPTEKEDVEHEDDYETSNTTTTPLGENKGFGNGNAGDGADGVADDAASYAYDIVATLPHDSTSFTQGLTYFNGLLYESTGKYGQSKVRILDPHTGQVLKTAKMSNTYFCEGLAYVHDRKNDSDKAIIDDVNAFVGDALVQLTWKAQTGFVYHPETLELLYEFKYNTETAQGWGITYLPDTQELVVSDGSQYLHYWNATNIRQPRKYFDESRERVPVSVAVKNGAHDYNPVPMDKLNELEYVRGWILANVWQSNDILKIHPVTGMVVEVLDMTDLYPLEERAPSANVLNGISIVQDGDELASSGGDGNGMDSDSIEVFVTGKQWPSIFRIKVHHLEGLRLPPQLVDTDVESGVVVDKTAVSDATPSSLEKMMECPATGDCYHVLSTLDHDPSSFTQGLSYADGILYESTGLYGYSKVRRLDPHTGEVMASFDLEKQFFGEGMTYQKTIHNNKSEELVQITWKAQLGIVYDALSLKEIRRFPYKTHTNQGWGITYMPHVNELVVSDGSEWLHFWNATAGDASEEYAYKELRRIQVRHPSAEGDADADSVVTKTTPPQAQAGKVVDQLNELEYMESSNLILANIWYKNIIVAIDPQSGEVARTYDLNQLWPMNQRPPTADCLNGISVTDQPGQLFVTGKKWPTIYRIQMLDRLS